LCEDWYDPLEVHRGGVWGSLGFLPSAVAGGLTCPKVVRPPTSVRSPLPRLYIYIYPPQCNTIIQFQRHTLSYMVSRVFSHFRSSVGLTATLPLFRVAGLHHPALSIAGDDATRLKTVEATTALQQRVSNKMATL
jgi:hypothetical protein